MGVCKESSAEPKEEPAGGSPRSWLCGAAAQIAENHKVVKNMARMSLSVSGHSELTQKTGFGQLYVRGARSLSGHRGFLSTSLL